MLQKDLNVETLWPANKPGAVRLGSLNHCPTPAAVAKGQILTKIKSRHETPPGSCSCRSYSKLAAPEPFSIKMKVTAAGWSRLRSMSCSPSAGLALTACQLAQDPCSFNQLPQTDVSHHTKCSADQDDSWIHYFLTALSSSWIVVDFFTEVSSLWTFVLTIRTFTAFSAGLDFFTFSSFS